MSDGQIKDLATKMRRMKAAGDSFVLMLGAGASISSGVPTTLKMIDTLLEQNDQQSKDSGEPSEVRFDNLWRRSNSEDRGRMLEPFLAHEPSPGYGKLAELIQAGYFRLAVTFNFDTLLETALDRAAAKLPFDFRYKTIIRGETAEDSMLRLVEAPDPPFKILKLHGSLRSADYFLFDAAEMRKYPPVIDALVRRVTEPDILICGYGLADLCVLNSFNDRGKSIVVVNPSAPPRPFAALMRDRSSEANVIKDYFDTFFTKLHEELLETNQDGSAADAEAAAATEKLPRNPFKFLGSYDRADGRAFSGRSNEISDFFKYLGKTVVPRVLVITGPSKSGKTSLVRAGLIPRLDPKKYEVVPVRCRANVEEQVPIELAEKKLVPAGLSLPETLRALGAAANARRVVLFLDQFDRVTDRFASGGKNDLSDFLSTQIFSGAHGNLTIVLVISEEGTIGGEVAQACEMNDVPKGTVQCKHFTRDEVVDVMKGLATTAGFEFEDKIIQDLAETFENTKKATASDKRFTLAHVHAVCHILASTRRVTYAAYKEMFGQQNLEALHHAINVSEFLSFTEDVAWPSSDWYRNMIKVSLRVTKEQMAEYIKRHHDDLRPNEDPSRVLDEVFEDIGGV